MREGLALIPPARKKGSSAQAGDPLAPCRRANLTRARSLASRAPQKLNQVIIPRAKSTITSSLRKNESEPTAKISKISEIFRHRDKNC